jgi:dTDP-4-dehydrorhamnose 3,5-epimerase
MKIIETNISDLYLIEPKVVGDTRGYFMESFSENLFSEMVKKVNFLQDNESKSLFGVLRGLHLQKPPYTQAKLVRVIEGKVLDVAVDLRIDSPTFGKYHSSELSGENKLQLFVPRGFAHGFVVLSEYAIFSYKVDNFYSPEHELGLRFNDFDLNVDWILSSAQISLSGKDQSLPFFKEQHYFSSNEYNKNK